jgi:alkylglycerol monooxygenase
MLLLISYLFGNIAVINGIDKYYIYLYGVFIFISVYAYSELMDRNFYALAWELIKNIFGIAILYYQGEWFGSSQYGEWINYVLLLYFIASTCVTAVFVYQHWKEDKAVTLVTENL